MSVQEGPLSSQPLEKDIFIISCCFEQVTLRVPIAIAI